MKKTFRLFLLVLLGMVSFTKAQAHGDPTWSEEIAAIFYKQCTSCHHPGGLAPFSLMNYTDAYARRFAIQYQTEAKTMPPWPPDPSYSRLAHERLLTDDEIKHIRDWVNTNAKEGDPSLAPTPPSYSGGAEIINPELTVEMPLYTVNTSTDLYRVFPVPTNLAESDWYITGFEVIPGDPSIVHHVLVFQDSTNTAITLDAADPGPGYTSFGGVKSNTAKLIGAWVPGSRPYYLPNGMGIKYFRNANILIQVHYPKGVSNKTDRTKILMRMKRGNMRNVNIDPILAHVAPILTNGPLFIPKNTIKTFKEQFPINNQPLGVDVSVLAVSPHMHLLGKSFKVYGIKSNGDSIPMIKINNWNFHWQGSYNFRKVLKVPLGSKLYGEATYDNTINNPYNPSNPPRDVSLGEATTDEMMLCYFSYTLYQPGDENIIIDTNAVLGTEGVSLKKIEAQVSPNPTFGKSTLRFNLEKSSHATIQIFDGLGKLLKQEASQIFFDRGENKYDLDFSSYPKGVYYLKIEGNGWYYTQPIIKSE